MKIISVMENNYLYVRNEPNCELQLSKRGLYPTLGGVHERASDLESMMWFLNLADGTKDLIEISRISGCSIFSIIKTANILKELNIIKKVDW